MGAFLLFVLSSAAPAQGQNVIGSTATSSLLATACKVSRTDLAADFCSGYVLSTFDLLSRHRL